MQIYEKPKTSRKLHNHASYTKCRRASLRFYSNRFQCFLPRLCIYHVLSPPDVFCYLKFQGYFAIFYMREMHQDDKGGGMEKLFAARSIAPGKFGKQKIPHRKEISQKIKRAPKKRENPRNRSKSLTSLCCKNRSRFMLKPLDRKTMTMCKISNNKIRLINDKKKSNLQEEKVQE